MTTTRDELAALMGASAEADAAYEAYLNDNGSANHCARTRAKAKDLSLAFLRTRGAELVELVGDAERLRWLIDMAVMHRPVLDAFGSGNHAEIRAAIDAMRADGGEGKNGRE